MNVTASANVSALARQEPRVIEARLNSKKLIVLGENFSEGAVVLIDGEPVNTRSDFDNPSGAPPCSHDTSISRRGHGGTPLQIECASLIKSP